MLDIKQIESFYPEYLRSYKRNLLREYLQYKILEAIFGSEFGNSLAFIGGTAIHIVHGNDRFSEDLDFDNLGLTINKFKKLSETIQKKLGQEGYIIQLKNVFKGAFSAYIKIADVLYDNGLSSHKGENLLIKVDAQPQECKHKVDKPILNKFDVFLRINVTPVDILLSQKLYAIFKRKRSIGRDFYDAVFLFGKTKPNFDYLRLKLKIKNAKELKKQLLKKCESINFKQLSGEVEQFLFNPSNSKKVLFFPEYIEKNL